MNINLVTLEEFKAFLTELLAEFKALLARTPSPGPGQWLRPNEACRLLRVSRGTLHNLRRKGALPSHKIGRSVFFYYDDIRQMMPQKDKNNLKR
jgi:excisionase family DNA binding protein